MELTLDRAIVLPAVPRWRRTLADLISWAGSKSNYLAKKVIEEYFGGVAFAAPSNVYLALLTVVPDDTSTGATITESDYTSYARTRSGPATTRPTLGTPPRAPRRPP
jgi:hypothetical protein